MYDSLSLGDPVFLGGPPGRRMKIQGLDIRLSCVSRVKNRLWLEIISRPSHQ